jgi:hypothetical protein
MMVGMVDPEVPALPESVVALMRDFVERAGSLPPDVAEKVPLGLPTPLESTLTRSSSGNQSAH